MDCTEIEVTYKDFNATFCKHVKSGFIEVLILGLIGIPLEVGLLFLGIRFVLRNKVDVPKYEIPDDLKIEKKPKKKNKKSKTPNKSGKDETD